eukprot:815027-Amphidinium_carterae.1
MHCFPEFWSCVACNSFNFFCSSYAGINLCACLGREAKADGMLHEGTIPASASRMTMSDIIMSLGH